MTERAKAGALLFRQLPDEVRFRDRNEDGSKPGDLEALLDGFGDLLDGLRDAVEQFHADGFAMPEPGGRAIQQWGLPYLADLVGAELSAPDIAARREELARTVAWHKGKGTLAVADDIADTIAKVETVTVEGWQRTLVTAREGGAPGMPNLRRAARAVRGTGLDDPLAVLTLPHRDARGRPGRVSRPYRIVNPGGVPCFPGAYDDPSARTPDMRNRRHGAMPGPHPARVVVHLLPPEGFFGRGMLRVTPPSGLDLLAPDAQGRRLLSPATLRRILPAGTVVEGLDRLTLVTGLLLTDGVELEIEDLNIEGLIAVAEGARVILTRAAVQDVAIGGSATRPALAARDSLIGSILAPASFAELEYVTVLGDVSVARLHASETLFAGGLNGITCGPETCIRYSRVPPELFATSGFESCRGTNTVVKPAFAELVLDRAGGCIVATPEWGEPGCGVLAHDAPAALRSGAEDEGEIGAFHHLFHAASLRALDRRLRDALPFGLTLALAHDPRLGVEPPVLTGGGT
ncbi:MAG: hypothetical protein V4574_06115 [Pseudomonadota bacterium]